MGKGWKHGPAKGEGKGPGHGVSKYEFVRKPARGVGGDRPAVPYEPSHGATSPGLIMPEAERKAAVILEDRPYLRAAVFRPAVEACAVAEARCALLRQYADEHGMLDGQGVPLPFMKLWTAAEAAAERARAKLGLDPMSDAQLAQARAAAARESADLSAVLERGRAVLAARDVAEDAG